MKFNSVIGEAFEPKYNNWTVGKGYSRPKHKDSKVSKSLDARRNDREREKFLSQYDMDEVIDRYYRKALKGNQTRLQSYSEEEIKDFIAKNLNVIKDSKGKRSFTPHSRINDLIRVNFGKTRS